MVEDMFWKAMHEHIKYELRKAAQEINWRKVMQKKLLCTSTLKKDLSVQS